MLRYFFIAILLLPLPSAAEDKAPAATYKVDKHLVAPGVGFDKDGACKVQKGRQLKAWRVPGFPARIPHFESCTQVSSPEGGTVEFRIVVVNKAGEELTAVDGVLELGSPGSRGSAAQAINWDDLEIPVAGRYQMIVEVEGKAIARYPLKFHKRKRRRKK